MSTDDRSHFSESEPLGEVLVVEDTPASLRLLSELLTRAGYSVRPARTGELGLASAKVKLPDLVLLDVRMPGLDGFEVCRRLKADPRTRDVPVVFLSALQDAADRLQGFRVGGVDYVTKPFQSEEVLARVRNHVQLRRLQLDLAAQVRSRSARLQEANSALQAEVAEHRRARIALERSHRAHRALGRCNEAVAHAADEELLLHAVCRILVDDCGHRAAWIALLDSPGTGSARAVAQAGLPESFLASAQADLAPGELDPPGGDSPKAFQPLLPRSPAGAWLEAARGAGCAGVAVVPLATGGQRLGFLLVCSEAPGPLDPDEAQLLEQMASSAAYGVLMLRGQRERRESEERFRIFFEQAAVGVAQIESHSGRVIRANPRFSEIFGYSREEIVGLGLPCVQALFEHRGEGTNPGASETRELRIEKQCTRKGGQRVWVKLGITPMAPGGAQPKFHIAVAEDVTERRLAEASRRESEERLRRFSEVSSEGIFFCEGGVIADINPALASILRCKGEGEVIGRPLRELCAADEDPGAGIGTRELLLRRKGGEVFPAEVTLREYWFQGRRQLAGSVRDIADRKRAEEERERLMAQAQAASRAKDHFLAVLSHELRNPLAAIQGGVEMLRRCAAGGDPRAKRALDIVERNTRLQLRLVNDLLDLARFTRGKILLQRTQLRLDEVVLAAVHACRAEAASAGIRLNARAAPELWVDADPDRLQQVVLNLLSNALKFTPPGGAVTVSVSGDGGNGRLVVQDTGIGIEPVQMKRLFQMFEQGEAGARRAPGLGIGLALVRAIAELHGGRVCGESPGKGLGSRFTVDLPLREAPVTSIACEARSAQRRLIQVALVEDNADARAVLAEMLEMFEYKVFTAQDAAEGLRILEQRSVDIVLADIGLPDMDGYEFLRAVHRLPRCARLPAFAVSGYGQESDARLAREAGYLAHFVKPVDIAALDRRIRECLGSSEPQVAVH